MCNKRTLFKYFFFEERYWNNSLSPKHECNLQPPPLRKLLAKPERFDEITLDSSMLDISGI